MQPATVLILFLLVAGLDALPIRNESQAQHPDLDDRRYPSARWFKWCCSIETPSTQGSRPNSPSLDLSESSLRNMRGERNKGTILSLPGDMGEEYYSPVVDKSEWYLQSLRRGASSSSNSQGSEMQGHQESTDRKVSENAPASKEESASQNSKKVLG